MSPAFPEFASLLFKKEKKKKGKEKKASLTFSVASQAGGKGQDKWIFSRSLACGARSLYHPARVSAWRGYRCFSAGAGSSLLEFGSSAWLTVKNPNSGGAGPPPCLGGLLSVHL